MIQITHSITHFTGEKTRREEEREWWKKLFTTTTAIRWCVGIFCGCFSYSFFLVHSKLAVLSYNFFLFNKFILHLVIAFKSIQTRRGKKYTRFQLCDSLRMCLCTISVWWYFLCVSINLHLGGCGLFLLLFFVFVLFFVWLIGKLKK